MLDIGSRKNIETGSVVKAIKSALKLLNLPIERIDSLATGEMKENEMGIIDAAEEFGLPLEIIPDKLIKNFKNNDINSFRFCNGKIWFAGVCEPSSLIAAGEDSTLIFRKTPYNGVTVAIAVSKN